MATTPKELRDDADRLEAEAREALDRAIAKATEDARAVLDRATEKANKEFDKAFGAVVALRTAANALEGHAQSLTSDEQSTTLDGMGEISSADFARGVGRAKTKKHPWLRAMYNHPDKAKRLTVKAWAEAHGYKSGTASSWVAPKDKAGSRRIPMRAAKAIEAEYGVPATLKSWPNGITTED